MKQSFQPFSFNSTFPLSKTYKHAFSAPKLFPPLNQNMTAVNILNNKAKVKYSIFNSTRSPFPVYTAAPSPEVGVAEDNLMVLFPMSKIPSASKRTGVPEIVTPGPPAEMVVPSIEKAVGFAVKTCPATVNTVAAAEVEDDVDDDDDKDPASSIDAAGTTIPDAPGVMVWPPITYAPAPLAVKV